MRWWDWYWTFLVGGFLVAFLAVELPAVISGHPERTLSWWVWTKLETFLPGNHQPWTWNHYVAAVIFAGLFSWLIVHFIWGFLR